MRLLANGGLMWVRTVSYRTLYQRARIRRFPLAEIQLFPVMWLNTQLKYLKWRLLKAIFILFQISYFHGQRKKFDESKSALTFFLVCFWSETINQTWTNGPYIFTTQNIIDFENQYPFPFEWDPSFTSWHWTANWNGLQCVSCDPLLSISDFQGHTNNSKIYIVLLKYYKT